MTTNTRRALTEVDRLRFMAARYRQLESDLAALRRELVPVIIAARAAGTGQGEVAALLGVTREVVRRIERGLAWKAND